MQGLCYQGTPTCKTHTVSENNMREREREREREMEREIEGEGPSVRIT